MSDWILNIRVPLNMWKSLVMTHRVTLEIRQQKKKKERSKYQLNAGICEHRCREAIIM